MRIACVGDSITFGHGLEHREADCYPAQLGRMLDENWIVGNFGISGSTLLKRGDKPYWNQEEFMRAQKFKPDIILILLGTNDSKDHNWAHKDDFVPDYLELIRTFRDLDSNPIVWIGLPTPVFPGKPGITDERLVENVIPAIRKVATKATAPIIDLHTALEGKTESFPDGVHPNAEGARLIAEIIYSFNIPHHSAFPIPPQFP